MAKLIKNQQIIDDAWQVMALEADTDPAGVAVPAGQWIVPLAVWQAQPALAARGDVAPLLDGADDPAALADQLAALPLVAVNFPKFVDGRGYSIATLLRSRYGYTGELRAVGDVLRDQFNAYFRCGFDALSPAAGKYTDAQLAAALASLADFTEPYQASIAHRDPLFRRHQRVLP
ncbi:DUF934 domain-containing protein [Denitromonas iodatirespirans]|uniref:DUF934 domain-containing protein n=1 Tax=Denitromonas iodatirespirans TaxID=2795389 RepID=A0A944HAJ0_DENI1|nr:DUF934 domain-containing protein [Denitromonas iodatirespirans]MBT0963505.1 DUF934 domain-containing protein [Denitromonas iodatirespirans]